MDFLKKHKSFIISDANSRIENQSKKKGRKWVLGVLALSLLSSLVFWFWGSYQRGDFQMVQPVSERQTVAPTSLPTPTPILKKTTEILAKVTNITKDLKGSYSFSVFNLTTKQSYGLSENEVFTAASFMKLPVLLTLYQEVEIGNLSLETKYTLVQKDKRPGAGSMQYQALGTIYTYKQMAQLMGKQSDNTAFMAMRRILSDQKIQKTIETIGMSKTSLVESETTPADMTLFFRKLYGGSILTREHREEILSFITETIFEDRIPAGIPKGVRVAHKVGSEVRVFSDAGIVFAPRPFILVLMSQNALQQEASVVLPKITMEIWEFETE